MRCRPIEHAKRKQTRVWNLVAKLVKFERTKIVKSRMLSLDYRGSIRSIKFHHAKFL